MQTQGLAWFVVADQARRCERCKRPAAAIECRHMVSMTVDWKLQFREMAQRRRLPVIGVFVRQEHGVDVFPRQPACAQTRREVARRQAEIDQDAEPADIENAGVAGAAAGEDVELDGHTINIASGEW